MITPISDATPVASPVDATGSTSSSRTLCHTPFGDVLVDELSVPNLAGLFSGTPSSVAPPASAKPPESLALADTSAAGSVKAPSAGNPNATATAGVIDSTGKFTFVSTDPNAGPTAESVFGENPFVTNPGGHGPNSTSWGYNPAYFATRHTADIIAKMVGGTVIERNAICPSGPMIQDQVNEMILMPDGRELNAGLVADIFNHERCQSVVARMFQEETGVAL